jgi:hypothetical protein
MSDDNDTKETRLDKLCSIAWAFAGIAVGALATVLTVIHIGIWWFP